MKTNKALLASVTRWRYAYPRIHGPAADPVVRPGVVIYQDTI